MKLSKKAGKSQYEKIKDITFEKIVMALMGHHTLVN